MNLKRNALVLSIASLIASGPIPSAFAGFELVLGDPALKEPHPPIVLTDKQDNNRLRVELERLTIELNSVRDQLNSSRLDASNSRAELARVNAKLDSIQVHFEKLTVQFAFGKSEFNPKDDILTKLIDSANQANRVNIKGFTDSFGSLAENQRVAMNRALAAKKYLIMKGVEEAKIKASGLTGQYISSNETEAGRSANRRVEIEFVK